MPRRLVVSPHPIDLLRTLFPLRRGPSDPTMRVGRGEVDRAMRTPDGPATIRVRAESSETVAAEAWGPGAGWALEHAPGMVGAEDDASGFEPRDPLVAGLWRRFGGVRITRALPVVQSLVPAILEQKVTGVEARRAYARLVRARAEPAPGPAGLLLPPDPEWMADLPYFEMHPFGVERRRAEVLRAACARAAWIEDASRLPFEDARSRLASLRGIGPWTAAEVARLALGDADAVSVGDYHLPHAVAWALAREPRGTDERMLELLEPYRGQRGRVQRLLESAHIAAPRFGPRADIVRIDHF